MLLSLPYFIYTVNNHMQSEKPFVSCFIKQTGYKTLNVAVWPYTFQKMNVLLHCSKWLIH